MRQMGIDYGDVRVGIALSDLLGITAQSYAVIDRNKTPDVLEALATIIREQEVTEIVVGLPVNMNGTLGERAQKTALFVDALEERFGLPVATMDERLSTVSAHRLLSQGDVSSKKRKHVVDKLAAALILQAYMDKKGRS